MLQNFLPVGSLQIGITQGGKPHTHEYSLFNLRQPRNDARIIGVTNGDVFSIAFQASDSGKYGVAIYVDGVNVEQARGLKSLGDIAENVRSSYTEHQCMIADYTYSSNTAYLNRFSQKNGENRELTFTLDPLKGVNYNTIKDPSQESRIEVYVWKEAFSPNIRFMSYAPQQTRGAKSAVGAGKATNQKFDTTSGLINPEFLGKATFIHVPQNAVAHLGSRLVEVGGEFTLNTAVEDPMNHVPVS